VKGLDDVDIRHFKLSSGEDIISYVTKDDKDIILISNAMQLHNMADKDSQAFYFTDWHPLAKSNICGLSKMHIISFAECSNNVKEKYIRMCLDTESTEHEFNDINIDEYDDDDSEYDIESIEDIRPTIH